MSRVLLVVIAALVLAGAAVWFATQVGTARGSRAAVEERPAAEVEQGAPALSPAPAATPAAEPEIREQPSGPTEEAGSSASRRESAAPRDAELARAQWVDGRVVFPPGTPDDEQVFVVANGRDFGDGKNHRVEVARDGAFRVAFSEKTRSGHFELEARYLYLDEVVRWKSAKSSAEVVLEPELGARIAGRVRPPAGTDAGPVGGKLELEASHRAGNRFDSEQRGVLQLSAGLDFHFDALPPGKEADRSYEVSYDGETFIGRTSKLVPEAGKTLSVELELRAGVVLSGVVRDENDRPIADVPLHAYVQSSSAWTSAHHREGKSAADGSFRLGAFEPGDIELRAELAGYEPLQRELGRLEAGQQVSDLVLVLARGSSISGTVRWPDGSPAEASLTLVPHRTSLEWSPGMDEVSGKSDASGAFAITGLSQESYRVTARATKTEEVLVKSEITGKERPKKQRSQWSAEAEQVKVGTRDLALTLSTGLAVAGRVVDDLGNALEDFFVVADRVESGMGDRFRQNGDLSRSFRDTDGSFRMDGFAPGDWDLQCRSKDHAPSKLVRVTLPGGGPVVLIVPRESIVRGRVLDPSGAPVPGAALQVDRADARVSRPFSYQLDDEVVADAQGTFEIDELAPGEIFLQAHGSGFAPSERQTVELQAAETRSDVVLRLRPGGTVLGEVLGADGRPQAGVAVYVNNGQGFHDSAEADAEGRFRASGVPPGDINLWAKTLEGIQLQQTVKLAEGETARVRLAPPGGIVRLHGEVRAGGEPLAGARMHAARSGMEEQPAGRASASAVADDSGAYELQLPGPGQYWISLQGNAEASLSWSTQVDAPAVDELRFDVSIPVGRISGRVTDTRGEALVGVVVQSEPEQHESGAGSARALTDAEGRYELVVPAGQHAVTAGGSQRWWYREERLPYSEARVGNLSVSENGHLRGVDLVLSKGGILEGVARNADGSSASLVEIWSEGKESLGWSDEQGRFELVGVAPGTHSLRARSRQGTVSVPVQVEIAAGERSRVEFELLPATTVHLTVRQGGQQVGSDVSVVDEGGRPQVVQTSEKGEAWVGPLLPGSYTVKARRDGKTVERKVEVTGEEKQMKVEIVFE